ncbi:PREDICTED: CD44 antigen isoform X11 [Hipposideros armiger]|uniref:CD44 antigen n=1 Tax=Hipposideros armiger TaxID=186990 RepID=A0A8B7R1Z8_HIPAR|nr:PREDICTED: CD44 antigen isoform X11 [Hipposideros armiger]
MEKFWWRAVWGLCLVQLSLAQIQLNVTCRYDGVFHVEKNGRYSISRTEAADLCKAFNCSLPTMAQMEKARKAGFETCRYGFIEGHVVIPRIHPNAICAANHTGVYILTSNTSHYDTYCFNASAPEGHDCASITDLPNAFDGPITISIINSDGSKYIQKGEYRTNPEDINSSNYTNSTEDDMSSGFSSERSTLGDYIFHTHLPTAQPTQDQGNRWEFVTPEETPTTITTASAHDSHPDQRMTTQSQEDSSWTYFFDLISHPMGQGHQTEKTMDMDSSHSTTLQPSADPNTSLVEDLDRIEPFSMTTQQSHTQRLTTSHEGLEEDNDHPMISTPKSSNRNDEGGENLPKDSTTSVEGYTPQSPDTNEYRTFIPVTPAGTGSPGVTEVPVVGNSISNVDGSLSEDHGSSSDPSGRAHTTQGSESAGHSSGSQGGANTTSGPIRKPQIPEWLIILASLLALALILAVCIAVNSRRRCGQKKKLVINNGNGAVEDRKPSGLNGEASKSQEMVHLVNKEPSETPDQFMTADETRNLQNVDMKIGV